MHLCDQVVISARGVDDKVQLAGSTRFARKKNAPVTERKSIAVEIPITRPNHYICSDARILVQAYVTSSVVQVSTRLTLRKLFCSAEHWI